MNFVIKIATPSGDQVLGKCSPRSVRFNAYALKTGYAAARVHRECRDAAAYIASCMESSSPVERAIQSVDLFCGIRVEKA